MAAGVKLHHPTLRNCTYTLIHEGRPLVAPIDCYVCGLVHHHKTYHLGLDGVGDVTVSKEIYARLEEAGLDELAGKKTDRKPEPQRLDLNDTKRPLVVSREHGPLET